MALLAAPLSAFFALSVPMVWAAPFDSYIPYRALTQIALLLSALSLVCGWYLAFEFLRRGHPSLASCPPLVWAFALSGVLVALGALVLDYLPRPEPYGDADTFRTWIGPFEVGLVLLLPLAHLWIERRRGKLSNYRLERP